MAALGANICPTKYAMKNLKSLVARLGSEATECLISMSDLCVYRFDLLLVLAGR